MYLDHVNVSSCFPNLLSPYLQVFSPSLSFFANVYKLSKLAQHSSQTPAGLFRPYWRTISVTVAKNFQCRPYMAEQLCDLLGMKVDDFLRLTEPYILPYLVLSRKRDMISRVGATYKEVKSPFDICSEKDNLAAILAFLLSQPSPNPEGMTMSVLAEVDSAFKGRTLAELVRTEPILIACDLLKSLGDLGNDGKGMESRVSVQAFADPAHTDIQASFIEHSISWQPLFLGSQPTVVYRRRRIC